MGPEGDKDEDEVLRVELLEHSTTTTTTTTTTITTLLERWILFYFTYSSVGFVYLLERFLYLRVVDDLIYLSGYLRVGGFLFPLLFSTFCRAVAEGGRVRPLLHLLYLVYVLSFFLVTAYD